MNPKWLWRNAARLLGIDEDAARAS